MKQISNILDKIFRDPKLRPYFIEGAIATRWPRLMGPHIASVAKPTKYEDGVLFVKVVSAVWRNELSMMSQDMIDKLNKSFGHKEIDRIVFR